MSPAAALRAPLRILVTAGPTREPIDSVRYISNRSSGRMGVALATAAAARGHLVTLLLGPGCQPPATAATAPATTAANAAVAATSSGTPSSSSGGSASPPPEPRPPALGVGPAAGGLVVERFESTASLSAGLDRLWPRHDVLLMAAAVSDHRPVLDPADLAAAEGKLTRRSGPFTLRLEPTPDLLAGLAAGSRPDQTLIGFALEPAGRLRQSAQEKLNRKGLHGIVANPLETMDAPDIDGALYLRDGRVLAPPQGRLPKDDFAVWLIEAVEGLSVESPEQPVACRVASIHGWRPLKRHPCP